MHYSELIVIGLLATLTPTLLSAEAGATAELTGRARPLTYSEADALQGAALEQDSVSGSFWERRWFKECEAGQSCTDMAEDTFDMKCPSSYITAAVVGCLTRSCLMGCDATATGSLCVSKWFHTCKDTTPQHTPAVDCGKSATGYCNYTQLGTSAIGLITCISGGLCYADGNTKTCGLVRHCD